ncbi:hypothetical protein ABIB25_001913 [Nakamurella sp. UYEF19]|uniref:hypothetical protein n=1 Tax=Nakamurella sp. UYEF19 TaxID=1756392 RepID=UPI003394BA74
MSGTPAKEMLQTELDEPLTDADIVQVAGDGQTGFFRRTEPASTVEPGDVLEAYNWGQLTSGTWIKSLWLLLVPFGMVNAAHFMLPGSPGPKSTRSETAWRAVAEGALRGFGLIMTVTLTVTAGEALIDLVAWQWTGLPGSGTEARFPDPRGWLIGGLAVTALIPVAILMFAGRRAPAAGEPVAPVAAHPSKGLPGSYFSEHTHLTDRAFDVGDPDIPTLRNLHLAGCWAVLGVLGFSVLGSTPGPTGTAHGWSRAGIVCCAAAGFAALLLTTFIGDPHRQDGVTRRKTIRVIGVVVLCISLGLLVCGAVAVALTEHLDPGAHATSPTTPAGSVGRGFLPGTAGVSVWLMVTAAIVLVLISAAAAILAFVTRDVYTFDPFRRYLAGLTGPVLASIGGFLGVGFGAAAAYGGRQLVSAKVAIGHHLDLPSVYTRIAHAWGITLVGLLIVAAVLAVWRMARRPTLVDAVRIAHNVQPAPANPSASTPTSKGLRRRRDLTESMIGRVADAWFTARVKFHIQWIFLGFAALGTVLTGFTVAALWIDQIDQQGYRCEGSRGPDHWRIVGALVSCNSYAGPVFVAAGSLLLLGLGAGLVYLGRRSLADSSLRRSVNVVWDVIAFWPRAAHPLVPPPYTAKAVDQLRRRIYYFLGLCAAPDLHITSATCTCAVAPEPIRRVVLAAHSQGSLLVVAALAGLRLDPDATPPAVPSDDRRRAIRPDEIAVLTFGSQLQFAYARAFPRYVNVDLLGSLGRIFDIADPDRSRWISLLRETDPIGGQVFTTHRTWDCEVPTSSRFTATGKIPIMTKAVPDVVTASGVRKCGNEWRLLDPAPSDGENEVRKPILAHSGYFLDPAWELAIAQLKT